MTDKARRYVAALQEHRRAGFYLIGNVHTTEFISVIESLTAELEQVKRERDTAVEELDHFCDNCKHIDNAYGEDPCPSRAEYDHCDSCPGWQWCGPKEE